MPRRKTTSTAVAEHFFTGQTDGWVHYHPAVTEALRRHIPHRHDQSKAIPTAIFLALCFRWCGRSTRNKGGWFDKTDREWCREIGCSQRTWYWIRDFVCVDADTGQPLGVPNLGLVLTRTGGVDNRSHYLPNRQQIELWWLNAGPQPALPMGKDLLDLPADDDSGCSNSGVTGCSNSGVTGCSNSGVTGCSNSGVTPIETSLDSSNQTSDSGGGYGVTPPPLAVSVFKEATGYDIKKALWGRVVDVVGTDHSHIELWRDTNSLRLLRNKLVLDLEDAFAMFQERLPYAVENWEHKKRVGRWFLAQQRGLQTSEEVPEIDGFDGWVQVRSQYCEAHGLPGSSLVTGDMVATWFSDLKQRSPSRGV
ncbi:MAG: hypothetical protein M1546_00415 [Chloroflexi bacterium]|nr:hypothetical protein [Chloroflexota bacterium]